MGWTPVRRRRGITTAWFSVCGLALAGLFALALDTARCNFAFHQLQVTADASALAALDYLATNQSQARQQAVNVALANTCDGQAVKLSRNDGNAPEGDIVFGLYDFKTHTFTPSTLNPNAAKVNARRTSTSLNGNLKLMFPFWGTSASEQTATAIATSAKGPGPGLLVLDPSARQAFDASGGAVVNIPNGTVQIDSNSDQAAGSEGSGVIINAPAVNIVGGTNDLSGPNVHTGADFVPDPLDPLPPPLKGNDQSAAAGPVYDPGYYPNGLKIFGPATLNPGTYYLDGDFNCGSKANLAGNGVLIYLHGTAKLRLDGTGGVNLSAINNPTSPYNGVIIFQDKGDIEDAKLAGGSGLNITGTIYLPSSYVTVTGGAGTLGNQFIVGKLNITGGGTINIPYDGRNQTGGISRTLIR